MKKTILVLTMILALVLVGCQSQTTNESDTTESTNETEIIKESENSEASDSDKNVENENSEENAETTSEFETLPNFTISNFDGTSTELYDLKGEVIVLNFWASWCGYCVAEMPDLQNLDSQDGVSVITINVGEDKETALNFLTENNLTLPTYSDDSSLFSSFGGTGLPLSVFIGSDSELYYIHRGMLTEEQIVEIMASINEIESNQ